MDSDLNHCVHSFGTQKKPQALPPAAFDQHMTPINLQAGLSLCYSNSKPALIDLTVSFCPKILCDLMLFVNDFLLNYS